VKTKRLVFCTNPSLYSTLILDAILQSELYQRGEIQIEAVYISTKIRTRNGSFLADVKQMIGTSGIKHSLYLAAYSLFFELLRLKSFHPTVTQLCKKHQIDIFRSKDINAESSQAWLATKKPDFILSGFFNQKIAEKTLSLTSIAAVNIHPALLPMYKGVDPVFYYFLNNEPNLGVSLHLMDQTYDTGRVLMSSTMAISQERSVSWHNLELFKIGVQMFLQWVEKNPQFDDKGLHAASLNTTDESDHYDTWPTKMAVARLKTALFRFSDFWEQAKK